MATLSRGTTRRDQLTGAMLAIVDERGLDQLSVREVAATAGVSIGTVQHYFATKDAMLESAFDEIVRRVRARVAGVRVTCDVRGTLGSVLRELLPLDAVRVTEARIQLAFSARAATSASLAEIQRATLSGIHEELVVVFRTAGQSVAQARVSARVALATTDGLAQHAVSTGSWLTERQQRAALDRLLDLLLP